MKLTPPADWPTPAAFGKQEPQLWRSQAHEADWLAQSIRASRLTLLCGEAGCGKTTLLRSGLMPLLRRRGEDLLLPGHGLNLSPVERRGAGSSARLEIAVFFNAFNAWNVSPLPNLQQQMHAAMAHAGAKIPRYKPSLSNASSTDSLADSVSFWSGQLGVRFLVILDQFDRYLEAPFDRPGNREFADDLVLALTRPRLPINVLIAVRDEAEQKLDRFRSRIPGFGEQRLHLPPLGSIPEVSDPRHALDVPANGAYPWERKDWINSWQFEEVMAERPKNRTTPNLKLHIAVPTEQPAPAASAQLTSDATPTSPAEAGIPAIPVAPTVPVDAAESVPAPPNDIGPPEIAESTKERDDRLAWRRRAETLRKSGARPARRRPAKAVVPAVEKEPSALVVAMPEPERDKALLPAAASVNAVGPIDAKAWRWFAAAVIGGLVLWVAQDRLQRPAANAPLVTAILPLPAPVRVTAPSAKADAVRIEMSGLGADVWVARDLAGLVPSAADVPLAIVSYDAIRPLKAGSAAAADAAVPQVLTPLFTREIGFLVRADSGLQYLHELRGKRIGAGPRGDDARLTIERLYADLFKVPLSESAISELAGADAVTALLRDRSIDTVAVVSAQPAQWLLDLPTATKQAVRLLALDPTRDETKRALRDYLPARIHAANYPGWLTEDVPTVSVMAFLAAKDANASQLRAFAESLCRNLPKLRAEGHPKWREVQPGLELGTRWPYSPIAARAFRDCAVSTAAIPVGGALQP